MQGAERVARKTAPPTGQRLISPRECLTPTRDGDALAAISPVAPRSATPLLLANRDRGDNELVSSNGFQWPVGNCGRGKKGRPAELTLSPSLLSLTPQEGKSSGAPNQRVEPEISESDETDEEGLLAGEYERHEYSLHHFDPGSPCLSRSLGEVLVGVASLSATNAKVNFGRHLFRATIGPEEPDDVLMGSDDTLDLVSVSIPEVCERSQSRVTPRATPGFSSSLMLPSPLGSQFCDAALRNLASPSVAMHPFRAGGGKQLLKMELEVHLHGGPGDELISPSARAGAHLSEGMQAGDDGHKLVERLFLDSLPRRLIKIESIQYVLNLKILKRFLHRASQEKASVEATFHGTRHECVDEIVSGGLLSGVCHTGAYGLGAYVGTHAGVAHQYADPEDGTGHRFMCIVLVIPGRNVVKGQMGVRHNAVTAADRVVNPTQYCFVDEDRMLVSHLITYSVTGAARRRIGGGWDDPFQRALNSATARAQKRRNRAGTR